MRVIMTRELVERGQSTRKARRNLRRRLVLVVTGISIISARIKPIVSTNRGTLTGDIFWLATIGFIVAIIAGIMG